MGSHQFTDLFDMFRAVRLHVEKEEHDVLCADDPSKSTLGFACQQCYREIWWISVDDFHKFIEEAPRNHKGLFRMLLFGQRSRAYLAALLSQEGKFDPIWLALEEESSNEKNRFDRIKLDSVF